MTMKKIYMVASIVAFLLLFSSWIWWGNTALELNEYEMISNRIPEAFSGFRIAQISDLHNAQFGEGNEGLLSLLAQTDPDIIVITGDLIDSRHTDIEIALEFCESAIEIAPVYYVTGNHEARVTEYEDLKKGLEKNNISMGMMYRNGIKYKLVREWESNDAPIVGWMPWPDMDLNRLMDWSYALDDTQGERTISYRSDGTIDTVVLTRTAADSNGFDVDVTYTTTLQVMPASQDEIRTMIDAQNTNAWQAFSWEEDQKANKALDVPLINTTSNPISTTAEALALAENECTVEYTQVKIYRDEAAGIWKIEYQIFYGYQGYQYVYLNDDGITVMISGAGSKVEEWQANYPGP